MPKKLSKETQKNAIDKKQNDGIIIALPPYSNRPYRVTM